MALKEMGQLLAQVLLVIAMLVYGEATHATEHAGGTMPSLSAPATRM
jgi:hypothetical protein